MRILAFGAFILLFLFPAASAQDEGEGAKGILVKSVKVWEGRFDPDTPASGQYTIDLITDAKGLEVPWKIFR